MNNDTREIINSYIGQTGAVAPCDFCGNYDVWADDREAERMVYAMATNALNEGVFRGESRDSIIAAVKAALDNVNIDCPGCSQNFRDED